MANATASLRKKRKAARMPAGWTPNKKIIGGFLVELARLEVGLMEKFEAMKAAERRLDRETKIRDAIKVAVALIKEAEDEPA